MPYSGHAIPDDGGFSAVVDAHYADAIHVHTGFDSEDDALTAARLIAKGLNLRDYEALRALGITDEAIGQTSGDAKQHS